MNVLGLHWKNHDNAAALVVGGEVVAGVEQERLNRLKHGPWLYPQQAVEYCLKEAGLNGSELDLIALNFAPSNGFGTALKQGFHGAWMNLGLEAAKRIWTLASPSYVRRQHGSRARACFVPHAVAHAASVYLPSHLEDAAILVADGLSDFACTTILQATGSRIQPLREVIFPNSLGYFYAALTEYLGFQPFADEYKVMGLAAYGCDRFNKQIGQLLMLDADGGYRINRRYFGFCQDYGRFPYFQTELETLLGPRRQPDAPLEERHADIAASLQAQLELAMLNLARAAKRLTGSRNLCLAGGVALNCAMNGRLMNESPFDRVIVGPASHDAGGALGAALYAARARPSRFSPYLGPQHQPCNVENAIHTSLVPAIRLSDPACVAASLLAKGQALGWFQGRLEFGPRALGNRSILTDPRPRTMVGWLNRYVKQREEFRPFAPAVLAERANELFELSEASPYMQFAVPVRPDWCERLAAITHVNGTARVQTVSEADNPSFRRLLEAFHRLTAIPCLLNTSLNSHGEPMVNSPEEALACFGRTGLRYMILEDWLVAKTEHDLSQVKDIIRQSSTAHERQESL
jgi:carbamoyltransferase